MTSNECLNICISVKEKKKLIIWILYSVYFYLFIFYFLFMAQYTLIICTLHCYFHRFQNFIVNNDKKIYICWPKKIDFFFCKGKNNNAYFMLVHNYDGQLKPVTSVISFILDSSVFLFKHAHWLCFTTKYHLFILIPAPLLLKSWCVW